MYCKRYIVELLIEEIERSLNHNTGSQAQLI